MKFVFCFLVIIFFVGVANSQSAEKTMKIPDPTKKIIIADAACGQCQFGLKEKKGCDLAVRINGKIYFVDGTTINEHGDAHAKEGFCEAVSKAEIQGEVINNRFKATYFKLVPKKEE